MWINQSAFTSHVTIHTTCPANGHMTIDLSVQQLKKRTHFLQHKSCVYIYSCFWSSIFENKSISSTAVLKIALSKYSRPAGARPFKHSSFYWFRLKLSLFKQTLCYCTEDKAWSQLLFVLCCVDSCSIWLVLFGSDFGFLLTKQEGNYGILIREYLDLHHLMMLWLW